MTQSTVVEVQLIRMSFQQREFNHPTAKATLEMPHYDAVYCSWSSVDKNVISTEGVQPIAKATLEMPHYDAVYTTV